ncbi:FAD-binding oxidoreductase [Coraliomargarita parva]|uniref:FAD-binding oxidoreductase n=1 Tax=Coraliomargarita parva TaxID=3014050 RepID=UPI0022B31CB7|nr:FAD-binding oxidoreductase [Coraliomargarita parva]
MTTLAATDYVALQSELTGNVILPVDPTYDEVRQIWNAMIDKRPAAIVQCRSTEDVQACLRFSQAHDLEVSVRGAGHNIAGNSICEDGLVIDFSLMKEVEVDPKARRALVQPGATLGDVDAATQVHGLAVPTGINSTTGIAGLTLGGGFGWLTRRFGMTIDSLISIELVTVEGKRVCASETEHPDLFWAVRGGGGNFGVVTAFEFLCYPVGPEVLAGLVVFPFRQAKQVLTAHFANTQRMPLETNVWCVLRKAPPLPFLPESVHGQNVVVMALCHTGDEASGMGELERIRSFGDAVGEHVGVQAFVDWQQAFDPLLTPGARNYWKSHNFIEMVPEAIDCIIEYAGKLPTVQCEIFVGLISGVANKVSPAAMAYSSRDANYVLNVHGRWDDPKEDARCIVWARDFFAASKPYASEGAYVNFMTEEEGGRVESAYGVNYKRLREIKRKYDPENILHLNQNIVP